MKDWDVEDLGVVLPMSIRCFVPVFIVEVCRPVMASAVSKNSLKPYMVHPLIWDVHNKSDKLLKLT